MFKRLFMLMLLSATFLGGYTLGRLPGSPDVIAIAQDGYAKAAELGKSLEAVTDGEGIKALDALTGGGGARAEQPEPRPEVTGGLQVD